MVRSLLTWNPCLTPENTAAETFVAFTLLKRPYAEFSWVVHSTRKRFPSLRNATRGSTASHPPVQQSTRALVADNNTPPSRSSAVESAQQTESQNGRQPGSVAEEQPPARKSNDPNSSAEFCPELPALAASSRRKRQESPQTDIAATSLGPSKFTNGPSPSPRASHNSRDEESHTPLQLVHSTRSQTTVTKDDAFCASPTSDFPKVSSHSRTTQSGRSARPSSTRQSRLPTTCVGRYLKRYSTSSGSTCSITSVHEVPGLHSSHSRCSRPQARILANLHPPDPAKHHTISSRDHGIEPHLDRFFEFTIES